MRAIVQFANLRRRPAHHIASTEIAKAIAAIAARPILAPDTSPLAMKIVMEVACQY